MAVTCFDPDKHIPLAWAIYRNGIPSKRSYGSELKAMRQLCKGFAWYWTAQDAAHGEAKLREAVKAKEAIGIFIRPCAWQHKK